MRPWNEHHQDWDGTAEELADVANSVASQIGLHTGDSPFNERLIRSYVQVGALDRPERKGREAHFGFRQLAQCLTVRMLLGDSWPLARIADYMQMTDTAALVELLPKPGVETALRALVRRLQKERSQDARVAEQPLREYSQSPPSGKSSRHTVTEDAADLVRRRNSLRELSASLAADTATDDSDVCMRIDLVRGCQVYVDRSLLRAITRDQADQLGDLFSHALIDRKLSIKGEK